MEKPAGARIHNITLRFDSPETESAWQSFDARASLPRIRFTLVLAFFLYAVFGWLDLVLVPEVVAQLWTIRALVCVGILAILGVTWHPVFSRYRDAWLGAVVMLTAGGIVAMLAVTDESVESLYYVGLILVLMATHAFRWVRFPIAVVLSVAIVLSYDVQLAWAHDTRAVVALNNHFFFISAMVLGMVASYSSEHYARTSFCNARRAEEALAQSDRLLRNILPDPVASRLKQGCDRIADGFPEVSIMFADIVDFSTLSSRMSPEALVGRLDEIFTRIDDIAAEFGIEKIKTIGDAWMGVSGLPVPCPDHAERMAEAALVIQQESTDFARVGQQPISLRIGLAIGPVIAGVIGRSKFSYDIWGEPVTMASRMQQHGTAGRIQVTRGFQRRLAHLYAFEYRGEIEVKGHGSTPTWWLLGLHGALDSPVPAVATRKKA